MSDLILHIGAHKTATTAIQGMLADSGPYLARAGLVYPRIAWFQFAQHRLAFALKGMADPVQGDRPDPLVEIKGVNHALAAHPGQRVLLSSEELFTMPAASVALLRAHLRADRVRILACLRRPDDMLLSIYNQKAKSPNNRFHKTLATFVADPRLIDPDIAYGEQLGKWLDVFGTDALSVFTYEEAPPIAGFFAQLGLAPPPVPVRDANRSVPAAVVDIMRMAKAQGLEAERQPALYTAAMQAFRDAPLLSLSDHDRRSIVAKMQPDYDALFARLGRSNPYMVERLDLTGDAPATPELTPEAFQALVRTLLPNA